MPFLPGILGGHEKMNKARLPRGSRLGASAVKCLLCTNRLLRSGLWWSLMWFCRTALHQSRLETIKSGSLWTWHLKHTEAWVSNLWKGHTILSLLNGYCKISKHPIQSAQQSIWSENNCKAKNVSIRTKGGFLVEKCFIEFWRINSHWTGGRGGGGRTIKIRNAGQESISEVT